MDEDFLYLDDFGESVGLVMPDDPGGIPLEEKMPINFENLDETKIDKLLTAVREQYTQLEEENSRLLQLSALITEKINVCVQKEITGNLNVEPRSCPLNLEVTAQSKEVEEEEEEEEEEEDEDLGF